MNDFLFLYPSALFLLWGLPFLFILSYWAREKGKRARNLYGQSQNLSKIGKIKGIFLSLSIFIALMLGIFALAGPAWNKEIQTTETRGRDVVFLVDVSQSMLAQDLNPNRLVQAQTAIKDTIELLEGDRAALVAFAGNAVVLSPLTTDYRFLRQGADQLSIHSVDRGGTMLGDALRKTMTYIFPETEAKEGYRDIILITDGEDQGSFPVEAAETLGKKAIRLICIGLGDEATGTRVPVVDESGVQRFLMYEGKEVWSRLDSVTLRKMAAATPGGKYLNISQGSFDLASIYAELVKGGEQRLYESGEFEDYENEYKLFLFPALVLMIISLFLRRFL